MQWIHWLTLNGLGLFLLIGTPLVCVLPEMFWGTYKVATNGKEAFDALKNSHFDLVFMDCQMPEVDGYMGSQLIRSSQEPWRDIPIVALTANAVQGDREKCIAAGMNDYLSKPVDALELENVLRKYLKRP